MRFRPTPIPDAYLIDPERYTDDRGRFARWWCLDELKEHGIEVAFVQANVSQNNRRGTLRGLHYQQAPHGEAKLIRCTRGRIYDVLVDLRPESETYLEWFGTELTAAEGRSVFVPAGCAHGYLALTNGAEALYVASHPYVPDAEDGVRYDDPLLAIDWPIPVTDVSPKDRAWPDLQPRTRPRSQPLDG